MKPPQIRLKTEGFRAIDSADIILDGITVVAGENGCGKSTLSKLLYYLYTSALNYEILVSRELRYKLRNVERFFEIVISDIYSISSRRNTREEFIELHELRTKSSVITEAELDKWLSFIDKVENNYNSQHGLFKEEQLNLFSRKKERLNFIIRDLLENENIGIDDNSVPFKKVAQLIKNLYLEYLEKIKSRPSSLFIKELNNLFTDNQLPRKFEVYEIEDQIVSIDQKSLSIPYIIQNTVYIDTPMMFGVEESNNNYWADLQTLLHKKGKSKSTAISNTISNEIINGSIIVDENAFDDDFLYKRTDGEVFNLIDCATGIKSFAILQLLINNGVLSDKTLLIIDEPESNLHPQWIIEYARIIVLLNKELGVKFFIASHNPDMVSAIKYISQKEGIDNKLNYYLAEKSSNNYMYNYRHLSTNIDPIFESFNIALDRIHQYGEEI